MEQKQQFFSTTRIAVLAVFAALAGVLQCFSIPMPLLFAPWLELNFSDIPSLIGTFALGPVSGAIIVIFKVLIRVIFRGTSTMFVGDLADILIGMAFVVPVGIIYKKHRTLKGALVSMAVGTACTTLMAMLANWLILVPFYVDLFFKGNFGAIVGWFQSTIPSVTEDSFYAVYLFASVLPFNIMRSLIAMLVTFPVYKHISRLINRVADKVGSASAKRTPEQQKKVSYVTIAVCATVVVVVVVLAVLRATKVF